MADFQSTLNELTSLVSADRKTISEQAAQIASLTAQLQVATAALKKQTDDLAAAIASLQPAKGQFQDAGD